MEGINKALSQDIKVKLRTRLFESINDSEVPCVFISYQRKDEGYASEVANYIMSKQIDVYFDLNDDDLRLYNQINDPEEVTDSIRNGINKCNYMLVIVSPNTLDSPWVPFEVGYAYDKKRDKLKLLRHKGIEKDELPCYLKVKEVINGTVSLNRFLNSIRNDNKLYESISDKKVFSSYFENPLRKYLDNE